MEERVTQYKDKDGNVKTKTKKVRVNTHKATEMFRFTDWVDRSPPPSALHYIDLFLLSRVYTFKYIYLSSKARSNYSRQKAAFIKQHWTDKQYDFKFTKEIPHHAEHCLSWNPERGAKPWFANCCAMIFLDLIFFGWIQRY